MTNPFDPKNHDRGPMTSGLRVRQDFRSHIDRLNGPWPCGPAVLPQIEERETAEALALKKNKKPGRRKKVVTEVAEQAVAEDHVDATVEYGGTDVIVP